MSIANAIAKNRANQAALRKEYAKYIEVQRERFNAGTMSMILPTYSEWLRDRMKR